MAGFDTLYRNDYRDSEIATLASDEGRVVLTRDRELLKLRTIAAGRYVHALKPQQQLAEIALRFDLARWARPFSLCLECNVPLQTVAKASVLAELPPSVRLGHNNFSRCAQCRKIYWEGSHWRRMRLMLAEAFAGNVGGQGETSGLC